jgi:transcriptional regulator with XRE-family HTH domain
VNTTGRELRTLRALSGVTVNALVEAMGVSRTTVWTIERQPVVKPETAAKYRDAIARLMTRAAA